MEDRRTFAGQSLARLGLGLQFSLLAFYSSTAAITAGASVFPTLGGLAALLMAGSGLIALTYRSSLRSHPLLPMLTMTCCVGGLGMLIGSVIDSGISGSAAPACHQAIKHGSTSINIAAGWFSWMNMLMLASCVPVCATVSCPWKARVDMGRRHRYLGHGLCGLGMLAGMYGGGYLLTPSLTAILGPQAGMHLSMLAGMVVGVAAAWPSVWLIVPQPSTQHGELTSELPT